jgi:hypothetical protein
MPDVRRLTDTGAHRYGMDYYRHKELWELDTSLSFPFWIVVNFVFKAEFFSRRSLFLFLRPEDFTEPNLRVLFTELARRYTEPENLFIFVASDKPQIRAIIRQHLSPPICVRFEDTPEFRKWEEEVTGIKRTGYYRAHYVRVEGQDEWFGYSPKSLKSDG